MEKNGEVDGELEIKALQLTNWSFLNMTNAVIKTKKFDLITISGY